MDDDKALEFNKEIDCPCKEFNADCYCVCHDSKFTHWQILNHIREQEAV